MTTAHPLYFRPAQLLRRMARGYLLAGLVAGLGSATADFAWSAEVPAQRAATDPVAAWQISISRASLGNALLQLAKQVGIQFARFADVDSTQSLVGPLSGAYSREEALDKLLQGTGLTYRFVNDRTVAIVRATGQAPQLTTALDTVSAGASRSQDDAGSVAGPAGRGRGNTADQDGRSRQQGFWSRLRSFFSGSWQEKQASADSSAGVAGVFLLCSPMATNCGARA